MTTLYHECSHETAVNLNDRRLTQTALHLSVIRKLQSPLIQIAINSTAGGGESAGGGVGERNANNLQSDFRVIGFSTIRQCI